MKVLRRSACYRFATVANGWSVATWPTDLGVGLVSRWLSLAFVAGDPDPDVYGDRVRSASRRTCHLGG